MDAIDVLVTAGGQGSRMRNIPGEKPLVHILGRPMIDHVLDALRCSEGVNNIYVSVSENVPLTEKYLQKANVRTIMTSGNNYVADLQKALAEVTSTSVLICPADLPLITAEGIELIQTHFNRSQFESLSVAVPSNIVKSIRAIPSYTLELDDREVVLCGVSVVDRDLMLSGKTLEQGFVVVNDEQFALNVNTPDELDRAEELLNRRKSLN
ncbi:MAG: NTP transferase domain-containing protein [Euryarchaeota archaeon]|nr:NTP transferase domain-containing protein [Euryarchaeota archaeon]